MKQKRDRYEMHKYWGKKPSNYLQTIIKRYSKEGDTLLDPFSGYGVFCSEAYILNRNIIANDLNPIANFINVQLLEKEVDLKLLQSVWQVIKAEFAPYNADWYNWEHNGQKVELIAVLRDKNDIPIKCKFKALGDAKARVVDISSNEAQAYLQFEKDQVITDWFPTTKLIQNSRISAKEGMRVSDLFTKRTLACHARLLALIERHSSGRERDLLKLAFTANLANCSKLLPPIRSRGAMAPGAWMTGFYIGPTYLENNVLHYFENRFSKILKGKEDYLSQFGNNGEFDFNPTKYQNYYKTFQNDAKSLALADNSIDYVFTDPPYGDAVPYFEQSIIWNSWLKFVPDYTNEIVISDSKARDKDAFIYEVEIDKAFAEIRRVLKPNKHFSLTYHSLSGAEWKAITNACIRNGFELVGYEWLVQKTFTPRQINRMTSIKGDVLVTFKKSSTFVVEERKSDIEVKHIFVGLVEEWLLEKGSLDTNEIFLKMMNFIFFEKIIIGSVDLLDVLKENFKFNDNQQWELTDEFELHTA